jgi:hypothetical protein
MERLRPLYNFEVISKEHYDLYLKYQPETTVSSRSFISSYAYALEDAIVLCEDRELDYLSVLLLEEDNSLTSLPPLGEYRHDSFAAMIERMIGMFASIGEKFNLSYMSETEAKRIDGIPGRRFSIVADPGESDYVYLVSDLLDYGGAKNANRRRLRNKLKRIEGIEVQRLDGAKCAHAIETILGAWCLKRNCLQCGFRCPKNTTLLAFEYADGVLIFVDGEPEGIILLGMMSDSMADVVSIFSIHDYPGMTHRLVDEACRICLPGVKYLNYEEDMGLDGLREFKRRLCPAYLLPKYRATLA